MAGSSCSRKSRAERAEAVTQAGDTLGYSDGIASFRLRVDTKADV